MSTPLVFDANAADRIEVTYATPDVAATRIAAFRAANPRLREHVLIVGCGPGYFLHDLAVSVGPQGQAIGVDISAPMLDLARRRCANLSNVSIENADAGNLPVDDGTLDLVCGLQTYAYIKELDAALAELRRVLRPGGRVVILDTDFSGIV